MCTKISITCALVTGLLLFSACLGGSQGSLLSDSAMRAAIGHSEVDCAAVTNTNCGTPGDHCKSCDHAGHGSQLDPCPDEAETIYDESYHLCSGTGSKTCRIEGAETCGRYYFCALSYKDKFKCGEDLYSQIGCNEENVIYQCRTCARGLWTQSADHTVIDYYCL
jgi:hypothetical protein